jgi:hypothetical protein
VTRRRPFLITALIVLALVACACKRGSPPDTESIRKWAGSQGYTWVEGPDEIRTEQGFFDYIDGAAQPIIDLGWKRSVYGVLIREKVRLRLAVHEMADSKASLALLEENTLKDTQPVAVADRAIYWDRGEFSKGILFQKGSLVCELTMERDGTKDKLLGLASSLKALAE